MEMNPRRKTCLPDEAKGLTGLDTITLNDRTVGQVSVEKEKIAGLDDDAVAVAVEIVYARQVQVDVRSAKSAIVAGVRDHAIAARDHIDECESRALAITKVHPFMKGRELPDAVPGGVGRILDVWTCAEALRDLDESRRWIEE